MCILSMWAILAWCAFRVIPSASPASLKLTPFLVRDFDGEPVWSPAHHEGANTLGLRVARPERVRTEGTTGSSSSSTLNPRGHSLWR